MDHTHGPNGEIVFPDQVEEAAAADVEAVKAAGDADVEIAKVQGRTELAVQKEITEREKIWKDEEYQRVVAERDALQQQLAAMAPPEPDPIVVPVPADPPADPDPVAPAPEPGDAPPVEEKSKKSPGYWGSAYS